MCNIYLQMADFQVSSVSLDTLIVCSDETTAEMNGDHSYFMQYSNWIGFLAIHAYFKDSL